MNTDPKASQSMAEQIAQASTEMMKANWFADRVARGPGISAAIVRGLLLCLIAGLHLGFVGTAYAQPNRTWTGLGADSQWTTAENWDPVGVPHPNLGDTQYTLAGTTRLDPTVGQIYVINKVTFDNTAGAFTITNSSAFWVGNGGFVNNSTSTQTVNAIVNLFASQTWDAAAGDMVFRDVEMLFGSAKLLTVDGAHNVTVTGDFSGQAGVIKQGAGTLLFSGTNTYTNGTTVEAGILRAGSATALPQNTNYTVNGGTLDLNNFNLTAAQLNGAGGTINLGTASLAVDQTSDTTFAGAITGTGGLSKLGAGNLNLTGANNYSGGTAVAAGTLSGTTTSLQGAIVNDANVVFDQSTNGTYAGAMSGTGAVTKAGSGAVSFTGANNYSGGTAVTAGTLSGTTTSLQGVIVNDANVVFDQSTNGTYAGAMSGTGAVTKVGSGIVTFTGTNNYSGTTVEAGILRAGSATALPQNTNYTVNGGTLDLNNFNLTAAQLNGAGGTINLGTASLVVDQTSDTTFAGAITGTGGLSKLGAGNLNLTGANNYSGGTAVAAGTLSGTTTSLQGAIVNDANVVFDQSTNGTYAGAMSGTGAVTKAGSGAVNFTRASTYTGTTTVNAGTLAINGSITSDTTVGANGALAGNGKIIGNVIVNGTTSAGNSIGTLGVVGNYSSTSGSVTKVEIGGTGTVPGVNVDRVAVTGAATINGAVAVSAGAGTYSGGNQYTFLTGTTVSGAYSSITDDLAFFNAVLGYTPDSAYFTLVQGRSSYADMGTTPNTFNVGTSLDRIAPTATGNRAVLLDQLNQVSSADANFALQQLTGSVYGSTPQIGVQNTSIYLGALARRLRSNLYDGAGSPATSSSDSSTMPSYDDPRVNRGQWSAWATGFGSGGSAKSDGNAAALNYSMEGILAGVETTSGTGRLGFYGGYLENSIDTDADESVDVNGATLGSYFVGRRDNHYFILAGGFELDAYESERRISFANDTASGDTNGWKGYSYFELGTNFGNRHFTVQPFAGAQYIYLRQNGFTETGAAAANLDVPDIDTQSLRSVLGARLYGTALLSSGRSITPEVRALWLHEFLDTSSGFNTSFSEGGGGSSFSVTGLDLGRDWAMVGAGLNFQLGSGWSVSADYDLLINDQTTFHVGSVGVTYSW